MLLWGYLKESKYHSVLENLKTLYWSPLLLCQLYRKDCFKNVSVVHFMCSAYYILENSPIKVLEILSSWIYGSTLCLLLSLWPSDIVPSSSFFDSDLIHLTLTKNVLNTHSLKHLPSIKVTPTEFSHSASALASFKKPIGLLLCH